MSSDASVGYMIATLKSLGYGEDKISKAVYEMIKQMGNISEEEAEQFLDDY